jgi:tetratricopeptide (TPR) repeat protein
MKSRIFNLLAGITVFMIFAAPSISFDAMVPAWISLPDHIGSIAIIDRSEREKKIINVIEGGITGEGIGQDDIASKMCLKGILDQLKNSNRYKIVRTNIQMKGKDAPTDFAHPLHWKFVEKVCNENNADAVLALEFFDTDHIGNQIKAKVGIRIYDLKFKSIVEEYAFDHEIYADHRNNDLVNLVTSYIDQDVVKNLSYEAGIIYGQRIAPYWIRLTRKYYNRPKRFDNLAYGARMMEVNDWDAAIPALEEATNSRKRKVRGRAAHNLAVIYEILGDYEKAKEWAQKAWGMHRNKDSKEYTYQLNQRIREIERLEAQLEE